MAHTQGIIVWGTILFHSRTSFVVIQDNLTEQWYGSEILRPVLLLFLLQHPRAVFQHDNAWSHTTNWHAISQDNIWEYYASMLCQVVACITCSRIAVVSFSIPVTTSTNFYAG